MGFNKTNYVRFLIVGLMVDHLERQFPGGTVTLQGAFADIEHLAQVVIIQQPIE